MSTPTPRPGILDIDPYVAGDSHAPGAPRIIKLSSNECSLGPSPRAVAAFREAGDHLYRYPDSAAIALRKAIAAKYSLDAEKIVCGNGSDELLTLLAQSYAGPGDEVLFSEHGFLIYPIIARFSGADPVTAPEARLTVNVDAMLDRVTEKTRMVFLTNPGNPTGSYLPTTEVARLREGLPGTALLVLDGAYAEYVTANDYSPGDDLVDANDNVVMTRTFSKIFGLSGLRVGWCYAPPAVVDVLNRVRGPFNVSSPAQAAALAALEDTAHTEKILAANETWRAWTSQQLIALGLDVVPSVTNFVMVRLPDDSSHNAEAANAFLTANGILPRRISNYGLPDSLRITIGTEAEMGELVATLTRFMEKS
jgi:histidinol-phosphate aminotransferase